MERLGHVYRRRYADHDRSCLRSSKPDSAAEGASQKVSDLNIMFLARWNFNQYQFGKISLNRKTANNIIRNGNLTCDREYLIIQTAAGVQQQVSCILTLKLKEFWRLMRI